MQRCDTQLTGVKVKLGTTTVLGDITEHLLLSTHTIHHMTVKITRMQ